MRVFKQTLAAVALAAVLALFFNWLGMDGIENCGLGAQILECVGTFTIGWKLGDVVTKIK